MIVFLIIAGLMTSSAYTSGKYYKSCKDNGFKGKECITAKKLSRLKR